MKKYPLRDPVRWPRDGAQCHWLCLHAQGEHQTSHWQALFRHHTPNTQLTCAETSVPSPPLLLNCNGPKHFHVGGSGGMLSVGHAACTGSSELSHRSRKQSGEPPMRGVSPGPWGRSSQAGTLLLSLLPRVLHSWCHSALGLTAVMGSSAPLPLPLVPEPYLCGI